MNQAVENRGKDFKPIRLLYEKLTLKGKGQKVINSRLMTSFAPSSSVAGVKR